MPTIAGTTAQIPGKFWDYGGFAINIKHPQIGAVGDGVTDDRAAFALAEAAGDNIIVPAGTYYISASITLNKKWRLAEGVRFKPALGAQILLLNYFKPGRVEVFDLTLGGTISFAGSRTKKIYAEWFGAGEAGSVDDRIAINRAITAAPTNGIVVLGGNSYSFDGGNVAAVAINLKSNMTFCSDAPQGYSVINAVNTHDSYGVVDAQTMDRVTVIGIHVKGDTTVPSTGTATAGTVRGSAFNFGNCTNIRVSECRAENIMGNIQNRGFNCNGGHDFTLDRIETSYCNLPVSVRAERVSVTNFDFSYSFAVGGSEKNYGIYIVGPAIAGTDIGTILGRRRFTRIENGLCRYMNAVDVGAGARGVHVQNVHCVGHDEAAFMVKDQSDDVVFLNCSTTKTLNVGQGDFRCTEAGSNVQFIGCIARARPEAVPVNVTVAALTGATSLTVSRLYGTPNRTGVIIPSGSTLTLDGITVTVSADVIFQDTANTQTILCNALSGPVDVNSGYLFQVAKFTGPAFNIEGSSNGRIVNCSIADTDAPIIFKPLYGAGSTSISDPTENWLVHNNTITGFNTAAIRIDQSRLINCGNNIIVGPGRAVSNVKAYDIRQSFLDGSSNPLVASFDCVIADGDTISMVDKVIVAEGKCSGVVIGKHYISDCATLIQFTADPITNFNWKADHSIVMSVDATTPAEPSTYVAVAATADLFTQKMTFAGIRNIYDNGQRSVAAATGFSVQRCNTIVITSTGTIGEPGATREPWQRIVIVNASGGNVTIPNATIGSTVIKTRTAADVILADGQAMMLVRTKMLELTEV